VDKGGRSALFRENKGGHNILFTRKSAIPPFCLPFRGNGPENIGSSKPKVGAPENEPQVDLEAGKWAVDYTEKYGWRLVIDADGERLKTVPIEGREQLSRIAIGRCFSSGSIATSWFSKTQRYKVDRLSLFRKADEAIRGTAERPGSCATWRLSPRPGLGDFGPRFVLGHLRPSAGNECVDVVPCRRRPFAAAIVAG
jgi:hypothetical protein